MNLTPIRRYASLIGAAATAVVVSALLISHPSIAQNNTNASPPTTSDPATELAALKKELDVLKGKVPDQSHVMKDVAYHFTNLWFAANRRNWPLAKFYCDETRSHLKWAVRIIPIRKVKSGELDLRPILDGLDQSLFTAVSKALDARDLTEFGKTYEQALNGCYSCHAAAEKPFLRLHLPDQPEARIIEFTPAE